MATRTTDDHEKAAAGMDYDFPIREKATHLGRALAEHGPEGFFEELEKLLPESWREHIASFPLAAVTLSVGVGVWLGMRKGDEIIAAGTALVTAAAMANVSHVMEGAGHGNAE